MLEINKEQLLSFNEKERVKILRYIALGIIKYIGEWHEWVATKKQEKS